MAEPAPSENIPIGLGTKLGALGTLVLSVAALVSAVVGGDHSAETIGALASAAIVLVATIAGRFAQAYAIYRDQPSATRPVTVAIVTPEEEEEGTTYAPLEGVDLSEDLPPVRPKPPRRR